MKGRLSFVNITGRKTWQIIDHGWRGTGKHALGDACPVSLASRSPDTHHYFSLSFFAYLLVIHADKVNREARECSLGWAET